MLCEISTGLPSSHTSSISSQGNSIRMPSFQRCQSANLWLVIVTLHLVTLFHLLSELLKIWAESESAHRFGITAERPSVRAIFPCTARAMSENILVICTLIILVFREQFFHSSYTVSLPYIIQPRKSLAISISPQNTGTPRIVVLNRYRI